MFNHNSKDECILNVPMDFRTFFDLASVMMVVLDDRGRVAMINLKGCQMLGYPMGDIVCKNWFDHFLPVNERKKVNKAWKEIVKGHIGSHAHFEHHILASNGEKKLIRWSNTYLKDSQGKVKFTLSSGEDITELRKPHHCAMIACSPKGVILDANAHVSQKLELSQKELVGRSIFSLCSRNSGKVLQRVFKEALKKGFSGAEIEFILKGTAVFSVGISSTCLDLKGPVIVSCF